MIKIPVARLKGRHYDFIGVRSAANDALMHGVYLDNCFQEQYMRVTVEQAEEIMKQIFESYREERRIRDEARPREDFSKLDDAEKERRKEIARDANLD